jgi:biotin carboxyl carrier protein
MKLRATVEGDTHEVEIRRDGSRVRASVDGRGYEMEAHEVEPGLYLLKSGDQVFECRVDGSASKHGASEVSVGQSVYNVTLADPKRLRGARAAGAGEHDTARITAPMPGKVVRVLVERGAQVSAGDGIVVVEAMKMQNEMKSPKTGTVIELHATPGDTVNAGDVLAIVE